MKKIFTLIMAIALLSSAFAQTETERRGTSENERRGNSNNGRSKLSISLWSNTTTRIVIDGITYNKRQNDDDLYLDNIRAGYHTIKIYQQSNGRGNNNFNNRRMQLIYDANVYIRPQYHVDFVINRFGKVYVDERQMNSAYYASYDDSNDGWGNQSYTQQMSNESFLRFKQMLQNQNFDDTRLTLAKQTISDNFFTSAQVKEIVQAFSFEDNRLEIAKYAYKYTVDRENYFIINDAFTFSGSREELARYVQAFK